MIIKLGERIPGTNLVQTNRPELVALNPVLSQPKVIITKDYERFSTAIRKTKKQPLSQLVTRNPLF